MMDILYEGCEIDLKRRFHFNAFMLQIHRELHKVHREKDPIKLYCHKFAQACLLLCLDEFQVTDIADAMILRRLLEGLLESGVTTVLTSNRHPRGLYEGGVQRASFIPCIELIEGQLEVFNLDGGEDYRQRHVGRQPVYY